MLPCALFFLTSAWLCAQNTDVATQPDDGGTVPDNSVDVQSAPVAKRVALDSNDIAAAMDKMAISEGVLKLADWAAFKYKDVLTRALGGDVAAIKEFVEFHAVADGRDGLNHGVTCLELIFVVGDEVFTSGILMCKPKLKELLLERLVLAQGRSKSEALKQSMTEWAPYTWAVLNNLPVPSNESLEEKQNAAGQPQSGLKLRTTEPPAKKQ